MSSVSYTTASLEQTSIFGWRNWNPIHLQLQMLSPYKRQHANCFTLCFYACRIYICIRHVHVL